MTCIPFLPRSTPLQTNVYKVLVNALFVPWTKLLCILAHLFIAHIIYIAITMSNHAHTWVHLVGIRILLEIF